MRKIIAQKNCTFAKKTTMSILNSIKQYWIIAFSQTF